MFTDTLSRYFFGTKNGISEQVRQPSTKITVDPGAVAVEIVKVWGICSSTFLDREPRAIYSTQEEAKRGNSRDFAGYYGVRQLYALRITDSNGNVLEYALLSPIPIKYGEDIHSHNKNLAEKILNEKLTDEERLLIKQATSI